jgi:hypothetical protein
VPDPLRMKLLHWGCRRHGGRQSPWLSLNGRDRMEQTPCPSTSPGCAACTASAPAKRPSQVRSAFRFPGVGLLAGFQAAIVRVLPQGFHDPRRPCPGEICDFSTPWLSRSAVDTVISVNRIFFSVPTEVRSAFRFPGVGLLAGFLAAIVRVLPQGFHDPRRPCPGEICDFSTPWLSRSAVDTVISVNLARSLPSPVRERISVRSNSANPPRMASGRRRSSLPRLACGITGIAGGLPLCF